MWYNQFVAMKRLKSAKKMAKQMRGFLKKNPRITEALKLFDISYNQYKQALNDVRSYTTTSTSPVTSYNQKAKNNR